MALLATAASHNRLPHKQESGYHPNVGILLILGVVLIAAAVVFIAHGALIAGVLMVAATAVGWFSRIRAHPIDFPWLESHAPWLFPQE